jgi:hypothetical protein
MAKSADADAAGPAEVEMYRRVEALSTIDDALVSTEGTAGLVLAEATGSCHPKDHGVRVPARGQSWVGACLIAGRGPDKVNMELAHLEPAVKPEGE